ncbi:Putative binding domain-containing protein, N-terminal [Sinomicrobium oceani]|uniref:Putative binding domain-containing protein, N-terminal n=1 Tax=Sinomicrobium oceani TaxID=1150368 RepID=A0A1K1MN22_9FLAO|nr:BACON domain-containing protein [Sinomicrobium oceani]SFW24453.1 Putative binding domain-containing protein, N-terminal [Sinomicrobium oceani]
MNTFHLFNIVKTGIKHLPAILFFPLILISCHNDDDGLSGDPYFLIEGNPTGLNTGTTAYTGSYTVRSNRPWQIVPQEEIDWIKVFPTEGKDDGIFKMTVSENLTTSMRIANFAFMVNGEEQPVLFRVEQEENVPFLTIEGAEEGISVPAAGGEVSLRIKSTVAWTYSIDDDSWLTEIEGSAGEIRLQALENKDESRSAIVTVSSEAYPELRQQIVISQSSNAIILEENFNWLAYGSAIPYETSGESRYDSGWTQEERERGWYSTPNEAAGNQQLVYARQGFVKLGKTNYGGDLISPKLNIEGTVNLEVTFKAAAYISAGGNVDDRILKISVLGAGDTDTEQLVIDNIPNARAEDDAGTENDIWAKDRAYTFIITGATSDTQIRFLGGDFDLRGVGQGKNRIFLDDIKVKIID